MTTTNDLIAEVRRLDAAATKDWHLTRFEEVQDAAGQMVQADARQNGNNTELIIAFRTAAPALADAVEARDRVIHQLDETLRMATIENTVDPKSESAATEARWMLEGDFGLELVGGKWRIRET